MSEEPDREAFETLETSALETRGGWWFPNSVQVSRPVGCDEMVCSEHIGLLQTLALGVVVREKMLPRLASLVFVGYAVRDCLCVCGRLHCDKFAVLSGFVLSAVVLRKIA